MDKWPVGVFTSIDAGFGVHLEVANELEIPTIQLHAPARETRTPQVAADFLKRINDLGIRLTAVFGGFDGESYADIPTVARTVGLVPPETRASRLQEMKEIADFAKLLECEVVGLHIGFVPHDTTSADYKDIVGVAQELCRHCESNGQRVHLETGQETADGLLQFIKDVDTKNLFVNFDPANMILYGTGQPLEALRKIGEFVRSVHCKDATWSDRPGEEWGNEVPLGKGQVDVAAYLGVLEEIGYDGPLTIEREIPQEPERQRAEILHARDLLNQHKSEMAGA